MHQWDTGANFDMHKRSAIDSYGRTPKNGKGHILLTNGEHLHLKLAEGVLRITCGEENTHVISIVDLAKDLLDVHIITKDCKTVLHKRVYDMGTMVLNA